MKQSRTRLAQIIATRTLQDGIQDTFAKEVAAYLISEHRTRDLESVLRDVQADWAQAGHVEVLARSAHELTESVKEEVTAKVRSLYPDAKTIKITELHDSEVIGGVRLNVANTQLDLTVEAKLNKFKQLTAAGKE
jgi:F0F1-type ATP synthase delta subunit